MQTRILIIMTAVGLGCGKKDEDSVGPHHVEEALPEYNLSLATYEDCEEINNEALDMLNRRRVEESRRRAWQKARTKERAKQNSVANDGAPSGSVKEQGTGTNLQEADVDEADKFKITENYIFVGQNHRVDVTNKNSGKYLGQIDLSEDTYKSKLFASEDKLVVLEAQTKGMPIGNSYCEACRNHNNKGVRVSVYSLLDGAMPEKISTETFAGMYEDSRMVGDHLILLHKSAVELKSDKYFSGNATIYSSWQYNFKEEMSLAQPIEGKVVHYEDGKIANVPCNRIAKRPVNDYDLRMTIARSMDINQLGEKISSVAVMSGGDKTYMTSNALYTSKEDPVWYGWDQRDLGKRFNKTVVTKVAFDQENGRLRLQSLGAVPGRPKDQWAFKELEGKYLSIVTTTGSIGAIGDRAASNHLFVLKPTGKSFKRIGSVENFGKTEDVRSVRYIDDMAYVVTFKKTDPLFAIDLSDPKKPEILSELKIPGFSTFMQPLSEDLMFGIGYDATEHGNFALYQGIQVSLFDISDPTDVRRTDNKIFGTRGSSSEATWDHHAFFHSPRLGLLGVPVIILDHGEESEGFSYGRELSFSGAIVMSYDDGLTEQARLTHNDLIPEDCARSLGRGQWWESEAESLDINRIFSTDENLISVSRFGIRWHPADDPEAVTRTVKFPKRDSLCTPGFNYNWW